MSKSSRRRRTRKPKPPGIVLLILSFIFRLLLLVVAAGFYWVLGMAIALKYPSTSTEMPLAEKLRRNYQDLVAQKPVSTPRPTPNPIDLTPTPQLELSEAQKEQLQAELKELQEKLNTLIGETAALEIQLGISRPTEKLENRLQLLAQQLAPPVPLDDQPIVKSSPPVFAGDSLMVTLPSDVLFEGNNYTLRLNANLILDNLVADLKNYRGADILVGAHTDDFGNNRENSDLSLLRAETVREYLSKNLGSDSGYHWVVVGYGETRPIVENKTEIDRQRNRRIEVKINR